MKSFSARLVCMLLLSVAVIPAGAAPYSWDGGGDGTSFGDAGNWNPAGSSFTTGDDYAIGDGSSVNVTGTVEVGSIRLYGSEGSLTIEEGAALSIADSTSGTISQIDASSTVTIDGTLSTGSQRYDIRGQSGTVKIAVNGTWDAAPANNGITDDANVLFEVNGSMDFGIRHSFGRVAGGGQRDHRISIYPGGTVTMQQPLSLQAAHGHTASIRLTGGTLDMGGETYEYEKLDLSDEDNGIIFRDADSTLRLSGDRRDRVQAWIDDGALRSEVGSLTSRYDPAGNTTTVLPSAAAPAAPAEPAEQPARPTQAAAKGRVRIHADTPWIVPDAYRRQVTVGNEPVMRALEDVKRDWYKVFGHRPVVRPRAPQNWDGPMIVFGVTPDGDLPRGPESFALRVQRDSGGPRILVNGNDTRGLIFAAYALSEEILGVNPWYFWTGHEPEARRHIDVPATLNETFGPPTFRYRGFFINDEDLLGRYSPDPLRETVYSLDMLDRICETILRLRGNMIVPGTFNFPDERCWEFASRRGLALNMHHISVVGLLTWRWPEDVPYSYRKHPEIMERYWRQCISAFEGFETVWTVGYRGKHDRPFWEYETEVKTAEERGAVITEAMARQVELIREVDPDGMIIANLWEEGSQLMHEGHVTLPEGVVRVWADNGGGVIDDDGAARAGDGIYYHTAMMGSMRNQLTELVTPSRIYRELGRFARAGGTSYLLVNVSDVKPVPLSTECAMRFAWNADPYLDRTDEQNGDAYLLEWSRREFGEEVAEEIAEVYEGYFNIPYKRKPPHRGANANHTVLRRQLDGPAAPLLAAGEPLTKEILANAEELRAFAASNIAYVKKLAAEAEPILDRLPEPRRAFYQEHVLAQIQFHLQGLIMLEQYCLALEAYDRNDTARAVACAEQALAACERIIESMHEAESGRWTTWYYGDGKVNVEDSRDRIRVLLARLNGEPPPPTRPRRQHIFDYQEQERFEGNFPYLYPHCDGKRVIE
ncbi:glycosyl hydrolase 115 family protein [Kiritimatiella glycovorans]|uniref:Uncharacterized protein n=1 Tax=Kiritimatiella glycovorans TaxID=1307763 RepID=A0A0G3EI91_9BACT|nr:glycosyl hydrolase 115 family protein [Kiritimatiella glycovorans]AKJ65157.1 hypothetical protein L21SP4_01922 [Kiritimatiella glycovorans]